LDFADDIALISDSPAAFRNMTAELQGIAAKVGLQISAEKTKAMTVGNAHAPALSVQHRDIEFMEQYQYFGSNISSSGDADYDYTHG